MELCEAYESDVNILAVALLHDVLEDTAVSEEELSRFLRETMAANDAQKTLRYVIELTDIYIKADYLHLNRRQRKTRENERFQKITPQAQTIKYADITDNCIEIVKHDTDFALLFLHECRDVLHLLNKGNEDLYQRAVDAVSTALDNLPQSKRENRSTRRFPSK
ncbi:metal-dependent phosphohydrolase [Sphingobacterium gobiense]|uniref:Metal-dependent phosphohydrolase n=2 Tax=Sphingobacterium gobiense TaxID=1382456 RepID=A0A2S9JU52_9SPHI|nr:metal-dependent phosphohydrolase [Sphingobacterium gobiense]